MLGAGGEFPAGAGAEAACELAAGAGAGADPLDGCTGVGVGACGAGALDP